VSAPKDLSQTSGATPPASGVVKTEPVADRPLVMTEATESVQGTGHFEPAAEEAAPSALERFTSQVQSSYGVEVQLPGKDTEDPMNPEHEHEQIKRERDLFQQLLELGTQDEVNPFLKEALSLIVAMTGARRGYIELTGEEGAAPQLAGGAEAPRFWMAHGCSDTEVEEIREAFSRGIIGAALATGKTIITSSAQQDPRFRDRGSVRRNRIEAVLCAPIGATPPLGVLYLQDRETSIPFSEEDRERAERFTRYLAVFADRLLIRRRSLDATDPTLPFRSKLRAEEVIGRSQALAELLKQVASVAPLSISVFLTGQPGTGKTQIARVIHASGARATRPFLELNCAALPEALFENELFGAVQGGHSGGRVEGKVAAASGGTLFLDEITELSLTSQAKLLQLLQSKEYFPLGSSKPVKADVRIIAATNVDIKERVARKEFREDLYSRLEVMPIRVPSLSERREDIADLAVYFCQQACVSNELRHLTLSISAKYALETAEWSANIRELAHKIQAAAIRAAGEDGFQIERRHVFPEPGKEAAEEPLTYQARMRLCSERIIRDMLEETDWNVTLAAKRLDLSRSHMNNLIKGLGLERKKP
jgi:Nif-specific regulatory protein